MRTIEASDGIIASPWGVPAARVAGAQTINESALEVSPQPIQGNMKREGGSHRHGVSETK